MGVLPGSVLDIVFMARWTLSLWVGEHCRYGQMGYPRWGGLSLSVSVSPSLSLSICIVACGQCTINNLSSSSLSLCVILLESVLELHALKISEYVCALYLYSLTAFFVVFVCFVFYSENCVQTNRLTMTCILYWTQWQFSDAPWCFVFHFQPCWSSWGRTANVCTRQLRRKCGPLVLSLS